MTELLTSTLDFLKSFAKDPKDLIALWGAILSTILAGVKGFELWRDRHRVEVEGRFTSSEHEGNEIRVRNLSSRPLIVTYWQVSHRKGVWPWFKWDEICSAEFDAQDLKIEPNSSNNFTFVDEHYFSTSPKALKGRRVVFTLHLAGIGRMRRVIF